MELNQIVGKPLRISEIQQIELKYLGRRIKELRVKRSLTCKRALHRIFYFECPDDPCYKILRTWERASDYRVEKFWITRIEDGQTTKELLDYIISNLEVNYPNLY